MASSLQSYLPEHRPLLVLAPMQDITDLPFWTVVHRYGDPDLFYTEYFRVHPSSRLDKAIVKSIEENPTDKPVIAQMIGQDIPHLVRTAKALQKHRIIGIDLNLGCPAPVVCKKQAGGGLLRNLDRIDAILQALRQVVDVNLTVKTRVGFSDASEFERLLELFARHPIDGLTIHGRTVEEKYRSPIHHDCIRAAVDCLPCPVIANGNVLSVRLAKEALGKTGAAGLMIGRGAIRNPWIFRQLREAFSKSEVYQPSCAELRAYIDELYHRVRRPDAPELHHVTKMKRYMNFIAPGIDEAESFLYQIRRVPDEASFFAVCDEFLNDRRPLPFEPPVSTIFSGHA